MSPEFHRFAAISYAHNMSSATAPAEPAYATLYATCAALMIAVLVVFYFDKSVRDRLSARHRGYAIGSLGGVIGTGLLLCLFVLAGIVTDTTPIRIFITLYTLVFLTVTFGAAISEWGREDAARRRQSSTPKITVPSIPVPRGAATEHERASELVAAGLFIVGQTAPDAVIPGLERNGFAGEKERLRLLTAQWIAMQPELIAVGAWYPSGAVRRSSTRFLLAGNEALKQTSTLFTDKQAVKDGAAPDEWQRRAETAYTALELAWDDFVAALDSETGRASPARRLKAKRTPKQCGDLPKRRVARWQALRGNARRYGTRT